MSYGDADLTIVGNLADDFKVEFTPTGRTVAKGRIVVNSRIRQGDRYVDGQASVYQCAIWGSLGEAAAGCLHKGDRVIAKGTWAQLKPYEDRNGSTIYPWELNVQAIGPDLRYAAVKVQRMARASSGGAPAGGSDEDPWSSPST